MIQKNSFLENAGQKLLRYCLQSVYWKSLQQKLYWSAKKFVISYLV